MIVEGMIFKVINKYNSNVKFEMWVQVGGLPIKLCMGVGETFISFMKSYYYSQIYYS